MKRREFLERTALATAAVTLTPVSAFAVPIEITSLPATITTSGSYELTANHTVNLATGAAIEIQADNVLLDLKGFTIENTNGVATRAIGVFADDRVGLSIKNGTLLSFHTGVYLQAETGQSARHIIQGITVSEFLASGMFLRGDAIVVKDNILSTTTRGTRVPLISCSTATMGLCLMQSDRSVLLDNEITLGDAGALDFAVAIYVGGLSADSVIIGTTVDGADFGIVVDLGCRGEVRDSVMTNVLRKIIGAIDLGNNV